MKKFDTTHLSIDSALERSEIHRDYIAHCLRWGFVVNWLGKSDATRFPGTSPRSMRFQNMSVFDWGCGKDVMLYKALCANKMGQTKHYTGCDIQKLEMPSAFAKRKLPYTLLGETDVLTLDKIDDGLITSFEVIEHVPFDYGREVLKHLYNVSRPDVVFILSTPVFDEKIGAAKNHINEMTRETLMGLFDEAGWVVKENYGTFGGKVDIYKHCSDAERDLLDRLSKYHTSDMIANFMAPLYPEFARNNMWLLEKQ